MQRVPNIEKRDGVVAASVLSAGKAQVFELRRILKTMHKARLLRTGWLAASDGGRRQWHNWDAG